MKVETWIFAAGAVFFFPIAIFYGVVTNWKEPLGVVGIALSGGLALMIAMYLYLTSRRVDPRPEDDPDAEVAEGAGELGHFAPHSWWPLAAGAGAAITFAGMAVGPWLMCIGIPLGMLAAVGWIFEFYRGDYAH